jgi:hypothetical protein
MRAWEIVGLTFALTGFIASSTDAIAQAPNVAPMIRGSWITENGGEHYIYIFAVDGNQLSGVVCAKCYDLKNLTFVSDGKLEGDSLSFTLVHDTGDRKPFRESLRGKYAGGQIALTVSREGSTRPVELALKKPPSRVAEIFAADKAGGPRAPAESFVGPGPSEPLTAENALGVWRSPVGSTAYLFKQVGDRIMGIACDSYCADGSYSAFISSATITRNTFLASIVHADQTGEPYANLLTLYLSQGRMSGTYVDTRRPEKRVIHVMVRQNDPAVPDDAFWRGAF